MSLTSHCIPSWYIHLTFPFRPLFTKLFRFRIKIRPKLNIIVLCTFIKTYYNYLTIGCWYVIKYVIQTRCFGIISYFYERKDKFYSCDRCEMLSPLINSINYIIVNCFQHILYYPTIAAIVDRNQAINGRVTSQVNIPKMQMAAIFSLDSNVWLMHYAFWLHKCR